MKYSLKKFGAMVGEVGYTTAERKSVRPTLELVGISGGFQVSAETPRASSRIVDARC